MDRQVVDSQLALIHAELGIAPDYARRCGMPLQPECTALVEVGPDLFGRPALLEAATAAAWQRMQARAAEEGVSLQLVSAYRSHAYQRDLILRKLARGIGLDEILQVNAAPGFSEHHSGRALDLATPGLPPLEECFDGSAAFAWLQQHAPHFGFRLSFPRNNAYGVLYEPWHWYFCGEEEAGNFIDSSTAPAG